MKSFASVCSGGFRGVSEVFITYNNSQQVELTSKSSRICGKKCKHAVRQDRAHSGEQKIRIAFMVGVYIVFMQTPTHTEVFVSACGKRLRENGSLGKINESVKDEVCVSTDTNVRTACALVELSIKIN